MAFDERNEAAARRVPGRYCTGELVTFALPHMAVGVPQIVNVERSENTATVRRSFVGSNPGDAVTVDCTWTLAIVATHTDGVSICRPILSALVTLDRSARLVRQWYRRRIQ